jgi:lysophospholipase L1-like esterase
MQPKIELKHNQTIVFIGDSITDADRDLPAYRPFGFGYVHFVANTLLAKYPELNISIINAGISGNTVRDLKHRWEKDCIRYKPDILSVLIGINDVARRYAEPEKLPRAVYEDEYELTYRQLLSQAEEQCNCQLILMEPFMFCDSSREMDQDIISRGKEENQMLKSLRRYVNIVECFAKEFEAVLVPLQSEIDKQIKQVPPEKWSEDSVHPYLWAHAWIAQRWLQATGL